jgi:ATP-dependent exoDNAse (exonuclease V) beta subunit
LDLRHPATADRSAGVGFGLLAHELLAQAPFDATRGDLLEQARLHTRLLALPDEDASAAADAVHRVLQHKLLRTARAADLRGACRRETPVTIKTDDGVLTEGVVDLAFEEEGRWTVVDYKTDRELALGEERYRRQLALYALAIGRATGQPVSAVLLRL